MSENSASSSSFSNIIRLNVSHSNIDDQQINAKIARIASSPITSDNVLNEVRSLVFRISISEIETSTRCLAEKLLSVAMQTNAVLSKEIDNFRHELLSLLGTLNFRFTKTTQLDKVSNFFNYISDGSISDLTDALPIIRQTFESADALTRPLLQEITRHTIISCSKRIKWLLQYYDIIDSTYFYPFLTLLTVVSFCARTFDSYRDQFIPIFTSMEAFIAKDFPTDTIDQTTGKPLKYSVVPLLALIFLRQ